MIRKDLWVTDFNEPDGSHSLTEAVLKHHSSRKDDEVRKWLKKFTSVRRG